MTTSTWGLFRRFEARAWESWTSGVGEMLFRLPFAAGDRLVGVDVALPSSVFEKVDLRVAVTIVSSVSLCPS